jgi:hypothetical protein
MNEQDNGLQVHPQVFALREKQRMALHMMTRIKPMIDELSEILDPLKAEHARWSGIYHSAERHIAEVMKKKVIPRGGSGRKPKEKTQAQLRKEFVAHLMSQSMDDRRKMLAEMQELDE